MIAAIFGDVHGNLPALEKFVGSTRHVADVYICLGDVVDYGPWNDECLEIIHSLPGIVMLEGNHERLFLGLDPIEKEMSLVQEFFDYSIRSFSRQDLIRNLLPSYRLGQFVCTHTIDNKRIYANTQIDVENNYIIGHTHHQYTIERSNKIIVNSGSIGQNRKYINVLNYALYDTTAEAITLCDDFYPLDNFIKELRNRGYSQRCINYYLSKPRSTAS